MNRGAIKLLGADFAGDPDMTRFSGKYDGALDRAQEQFALDSKALWKDTTWSHAADDADEDLPSDFMWEDWVTYDGVKLAPITRYELLQLHGDDWTTKTAAVPTNFIIDPEEAVKEIVLFPIPQDAKTLAMRYFPLPASSTTDSDIPLNSSALLAQFHIGLAAYLAWLLLMAEPATPENATKKRELLDVYNDQVTKATDYFKNTQSAGLKIKGTRTYGYRYYGSKKFR